MPEFLELQKQIKECQECKEMFGFVPQPIVWGHQKAKIMQISQAPSLLVQETKRPFNDLSGKRLRKNWYQISDAMFYNQDFFYITSIAHCYPGKSKHGGDRIPPKNCAKKWLYQEMEIVDNEIFIVIGSHAAKFLFPNKNFTELVFHDQTLQGKLTFVLPHPSPLNQRWFKQHPDFEAKRITRIRNKIKSVLKEE